MLQPPEGSPTAGKAPLEDLAPGASGGEGQMMSRPTWEKHKTSLCLVVVGVSEECWRPPPHSVDTLGPFPFAPGIHQGRSQISTVAQQWGGKKEPQGTGTTRLSQHMSNRGN